MHIHIVCSTPGADQVLPRKAGYLASGQGWRIASQPDPKADVNLFFPYIDWAQRFPGWHETKTAAFFSHKDVHAPLKVGWWDAAAEGVDLRCCCSEKYAAALRPYGPTVIVRPPIERDRFMPALHPWPDRPVVGISGDNYKDGRKGEDLIIELAQSDLGRQLEWRASGRGWPIPHQWRQWRDMHAFYQSLDIFLCASRIEGVPMTPLEALSCGVRVIIPRNVGMMDELPGLPGIYRFKAGSYQGLHAALRRALNDRRVDPWALRDVTLPYTPENWGHDFCVAFESLLRNAEPPEKSPGNWRDNAGMYCVAFGGPSRRCAARCIETFKKHMPDIPVLLASTEPLGPEDIFVRREDVDIGGRLAKLAAYEMTPPRWRYVLYLDADTETVGDLSFLYQLLADGWETVIAKDMVKYHVARMMIRPDNHDEYKETMAALGTGEVMQYNGGVFAFRRCDRVKRYFERWNKEWQKYAARDQGALLRALYANPLRLFVLPNQWNASDRYPLPPGDVAVIHHNMSARRWRGLIWGRTDSREAWDKVREFTGMVE